MSEHAAVPRAMYSDWYVMQTLVGREQAIGDRLRRHYFSEDDVALPMRRLTLRRGGDWFDTTKPLFPGYLFFRGGGADAREREERFQLLQRSRRDLNGMIRIVTQGQAPVPLYRHEASMIWSLMQDTETIDYSVICFAGGSVKVIRGPMTGMEGIIRNVDRRKKRLKVELFFMGELRLVDLGIREIEVVT